ncbi:TIGR03619 family F420-dependent LLM class oxidoreductase [Hamadaea tsunoensis]|uniref:TIGR03619 family F420-dependent LLM class oxidoreductase n=1 Tax=Hamadaea tsunoensis TaxID=53368 RepID=UPI0004190D3B|nr:TIGR03619 family F420-dependent LLM class oxidoreductase [Hamadaea tsunoensis]
MRYGIDVCTLGEFADPGRVVEVAVAAEAAGWEALFVWDHLAFAWGVPSADPWVTLSAVAQATTRIRLGTAVTALPRRRPVVVANAVATLDRLSGGRFVFGAGLGGVAAEFAAFDDPADTPTRAARLDEGLDLLTALWTGERVDHHGLHYTVDNVALAPRPVQERVPVWIGGHSSGAMRRAAQWDGWIAGGDDEDGNMVMSPAKVAEHVQRLRRLRGDDLPFDVALVGVSAPDDAVLVRAYADAGVTWWLEHIHGRRDTYDNLLARVAAGPPTHDRSAYMTAST